MADHSTPLRVLISGVGGQGVITAARILAETALRTGHEAVVGELHGMAQRGGSVQSSILIDAGHGSIIPRGGADLVLGFEPIETVRAADWISRKTVVLANTRPVVPFTLTLEGRDYPDMTPIWERVRQSCSRLVTVDATEMALAAGSARTLSTVMLGLAAGAKVLPFGAEEILRSIEDLSPERYREENRRAFQLTMNAGRNERW